MKLEELTHGPLLAKFQVAFSKAVDGKGLLAVNSQAAHEREGRYFRGGMGRGSPDLVGLMQHPNGRGIPLVVEIKTSKDTVKPDQWSWLKRYRQLGGVALVVNPQNFDAALDWLQSLSAGNTYILNPLPANTDFNLSTINRFNSIHFVFEPEPKA